MLLSGWKWHLGKHFAAPLQISPASPGTEAQSQEPEAQEINQEALEFEAQAVDSNSQQAAQSGEGSSDLVLDLKDELFIPGLMHITHNITAGLQDSLKQWPHFIELLTHVCRLVRAKWSKARLLHTCFAQQPWLACRSLLEGFTAQVYQGRWNSAMDAVKQVSRVLQVLKGAWNLQKFGPTSNAHGLGLRPSATQSCNWQRYLCYVPSDLHQCQQKSTGMSASLGSC